MGWKEFEVDCVWCVEKIKMVVVWVAVVFNEDGFDLQCWEICPAVVDESDEADALDPHPELSARLRLVISVDSESMGANEYVGFEGVYGTWGQCEFGILYSDAWSVEDAVD